jgi:hypothetical protein
MRMPGLSQDKGWSAVRQESNPSPSPGHEAKRRMLIFGEKNRLRQKPSLPQ